MFHECFILNFKYVIPIFSVVAPHSIADLSKYLMPAVLKHQLNTGKYIGVSKLNYRMNFAMKK